MIRVRATFFLPVIWFIFSFPQTCCNRQINLLDWLSVSDIYEFSREFYKSENTQIRALKILKEFTCRKSIFVCRIISTWACVVQHVPTRVLACTCSYARPRVHDARAYAAQNARMKGKPLSPPRLLRNPSRLRFYDTLEKMPSPCTN